VLQLVRERQLTAHARSLPGGHSRRAIAYAALPEATEEFRRAHPPQPEEAFYGSSSEDTNASTPTPRESERQTTETTRRPG
jgi:hypothetical protein